MIEADGWALGCESGWLGYVEVQVLVGSVFDAEVPVEPVVLGVAQVWAEVDVVIIDAFDDRVASRDVGVDLEVHWLIIKKNRPLVVGGGV